MNRKPTQTTRKPGAACITKRTEKTERLLSRSYRKDQILIFYKRKPTEKDIQIIKKSFNRQGFDTTSVKIKSCGNCDIPVQLWSAKGIHSWISKDSIKAGSGPSSTTVGEHYSLNFLNNIPVVEPLKFEVGDGQQKPVDIKKDEIVIAVLDTGLDTSLVNPIYLWHEDKYKRAEKCYQDVKEGWNFVEDKPGFNDDNPAKHGSIVSQYIINEFTRESVNAVKIMSLKTHDKDGVGDLFSVVCAINFAIAKGANIINASWGFYYYYEDPIPYFKALITGVLRKKGILFVTAAGNKIAADDLIAKKIYEMEHGSILTEDQLRNLAIHNFYPADLSTATNNVITVTTTDGKTVSPTQNYSKKYADLGVVADSVLRNSGMSFKLPFKQIGREGVLISGSSFATAIASGVIGANCTKQCYKAGIRKSDFFTELQTLFNADGTGNLLENISVLAKKHIRNGSCLS